MNINDYIKQSGKTQVQLAKDVGTKPQQIVKIKNRGAELTELANGNWALIQKNALIFKSLN